MGVINRADLADMFFAEFEEHFPLIVAACDGIGPSGPWTITDADNPRFKLRFMFEEKLNDDGPTLIIQEVVPGPGNAGLLKRLVNFAVDFAEKAELYDVVIGTLAEDAAGRQMFVNALCAITPRLRPAGDEGCVRTRAN